MKKLSKVLALVLAFALVLGLGATAFATDVTINSPSGGDTGSTYTGWMLLTATPDATQDPETYTYSVNSKYATALQQVTGKTTDADVYKYIKDLGADDAAAVQAFAQAMYDKVKGMAGDGSLTTGSAADLANGYWLIAETTVGDLPDGSDGVATRILLDTAGTEALTIEAKESYPTPDKKITAVTPVITDGTTGAVKDDDSAVAQIGDIITFQIKATLPTNFDKYVDNVGGNGYYLEFTDTLENMTYIGVTSVTIGGVAADATKYSNTSSGTSVAIKWDNIGLDTNAGNGKEVVVTYTAKVTENANIGDAGNKNEVKITYSNNPNGDGKGESTPVEVKVYTFKLEINKVKEDGTSPLAGAKFVLKKGDKYYKYNDSTKNVEWVDAEADATVRISNAEGKLDADFIGLAEGTYTVHETEAPAGYNLANDTTFTISTAAVADNDSLTITITGDATATEDKNATETIINQKGAELPSTGGIGTTIFYIVGSLLVVGAGILLVTRKRMTVQ